MNYFFSISVIALMLMIGGCAPEKRVPYIDPEGTRDTSKMFDSQQISEESQYHFIPVKEYGVEIGLRRYRDNMNALEAIVKDGAIFIVEEEEIKQSESYELCHSEKFEPACNTRYNGKQYYVLDKIEPIRAPQGASIEEKVNKIITSLGKDPNDCLLTIGTKESWAIDPYVENKASIIMFGGKLEYDMSEMQKEEYKNPYPQESDEYFKRLVEMYKKELRENESDLGEEMKRLIDSLGVEGQEDIRIGAAISGFPGKQIAERRCAVFPNQFLTNWKVGHLIFIPEATEYFYPIRGASGGEGPFIADVRAMTKK